MIFHNGESFFFTYRITDFYWIVLQR